MARWRALSFKSNRNSQKRWNKRLLVVLPLSAVLLFWLIKDQPWRFKKFIFKTADLSCVGNNDLLKAITLSGYNFFSFNELSLEKALKEKYDCLGSIKLNKKFPQTVEISAVERRGLFLIKGYELPEATDSAQLTADFEGAVERGQFLVDNRGFVFKANSSASNLPVVNYYGGQLREGMHLRGDLVQNLSLILQKLTELNIAVSEIKIAGDRLVLRSEPLLEFSLSKDPLKQIVSLQLILQRAKMDSKQIDKVDLRFDKAVVLYSSRKSS